jgi:uncharacterized membrane protein HdeD (DUF308 family)
METQIKAIAHSWYLELIIGILFMAVGVWVIFTPLTSYVAFSIFFAITFLLTGIMETTFAISSRKYVAGWGWSLAGGIVDILIGLLLVSTPSLSIAILPFYVGFALLFRSSMAIGLSFELSRYKVPNWGLLLLIGILGVIVAFIMIWNPVFAGLTIVVYTAIAFISIGIFRVYVSFKLRKLNEELK